MRANLCAVAVTTLAAGLGSHATVALAEPAATERQRLGGHAQRADYPIVHSSRLCAKYPSAADPVVRAESPP